MFAILVVPAESFDKESRFTIQSGYATSTVLKISNQIVLQISIQNVRNIPLSVCVIVQWLKENEV